MMEMLQMFIWKLAFWASGLVFVFPMEKRENFRKRAAVIAAVICVEAVCFGMFWDGGIGKNVWGMAPVSVLMVMFLYMGWELSFMAALYYSIWAMVVWQLLLEFWVCICLFLWKGAREETLLSAILCLVYFGASFGLFAGTIARWMPKDRKKIGPRQTLSALLLYFIIEMLSYAPTLRNLGRNSEDWKFLLMSQIICVIILYMQNELFKKIEIKEELVVTKLLWKKAEDQYRLSTENIALLNQKSHDLKHQIRALRQIKGEEFEAYLQEIEENVNIYEAVVKTGNHVLDTILTEKSLYCKSRGIQVSCVADGSQMGFFDTVDLYALLGNAMDNAIEAVEKFEDVEKRQIDVLIYRKQDFLILQFINPMPERLVYEKGFPVTTKGDRKFHGFGLKSIEQMVRKYDGTMDICEEDGCFSLKLLIPVPKEEAAPKD